MAKVGIGIIGTGSIAGAYLRAYARYPELCRVVAVADIDRQRAQKFAAGAGDSVAAYGDYKELLRRDDIDAVSICTPPFAHAEIAVAALNAGKHVLVEKPMAASLAEADAMLAAAEQNDKKLAVVFQNRWRHDWMRAKALIDGEHLGRILFGKVDCLWWRGDEYYDMWWRGTWEQECGGATINHAIHHIDAFLWLMGEPEWVIAEMGAVDHDIEVEDLSMAIVRFRNGALGQITSTVAAMHNFDRIEVFGSKASLALPWALYSVASQPNGFPKANPEYVEKLQALADGLELGPQWHEGQILDFLEAVTTGKRPLVDGVEGRRSLELVTAIYKSATTGERVQLPLAPDDPFYTTEGLRANVVRFPSSKSAVETL